MESRDTSSRYMPSGQQSLANKRKDKDVMKLLVSDYDVTLVNENSNNEFIVKMKGPINSSYEGVSQENGFCNI